MFFCSIQTVNEENDIVEHFNEPILPMAVDSDERILPVDSEEHEQVLPIFYVPIKP